MKFRIDMVRVGDDGTEQSSAMMVLSRGPLALETLALTLAESKELLHNVQTYLVEQQAAAYLEQHRSCPQCGQHYTSKGRGSSTINTVFGPVAVPNPRWHCCTCQLSELNLLETAGTGDGVRVVMLTKRAEMETVLDYVVQGNTAQMNNHAFMRELKSWIRFNDQEATRKGDGLSGRTTGNPSIPRWLGNLLSKLLFRAQPENDKNTRYIRSSAGIAVFVSDVNDKAHWVEAGRCYERFALQTTVLGIRNAFVNQPVEEACLRPVFAQALGLGSGRPDLVVGFGRGPAMPSSLRRSLEAVIF